MKHAAVVFNSIASNFGLTFRFTKTRFIGIVTELCDPDKLLGNLKLSMSPYLFRDLGLHGNTGKSPLDMSIHIMGLLKNAVLFNRPSSTMHIF